MYFKNTLYAQIASGSWRLYPDPMILKFLPRDAMRKRTPSTGVCLSMTC